MACFAEDEACKPFKDHWLPDVKTGLILKNANCIYVFLYLSQEKKKNQQLLSCVT
jgi:hypothetical protein